MERLQNADEMEALNKTGSSVLLFDNRALGAMHPTRTLNIDSAFYGD